MLEKNIKKYCNFLKKSFNLIVVVTSVVSSQPIFAATEDVTDENNDVAVEEASATEAAPTNLEEASTQYCNAKVEAEKQDAYNAAETEKQVN